MIQIPSTLQDRVEKFKTLRDFFGNFGFVLGGNWDEQHGYFDYALDEARKVWVRIPFEVTTGKLDAASEDADVPVRLGCPFVLRHLYQEGLDEEAQVRTYGGLIDQFQEPADKDAKVGSSWLEQAKATVRRLEKQLERLASKT